MIRNYNITEETAAIARQLMFAVSIMVVFQSAQSVLTKGVLRGGGDTLFLMIADVLFLWIASVPLGAFAGLVWHLEPFYVYTLLKIDWAIKTFICAYRLKSKKWIRIV
jgi:Na+-driven multidrug efflux pump